MKLDELTAEVISTSPCRGQPHAPGQLLALRWPFSARPKPYGHRVTVQGRLSRRSRWALSQASRSRNPVRIRLSRRPAGMAYAADRPGHENPAC
jgi:hypothetical protein